jgi:ribosomal protein S18 acetylase RimI-like enzyme
MLTIKNAQTKEDIKKIAALAQIIWMEHFTPIIGIDQVQYMLDKFQSAEAIEAMIETEGYVYYMAYDNGVLAGYMGFHPDETKQSILLSKIYVEKSFRKRSIAKTMIETVTKQYPAFHTLWLTVNRHNDDSIAAYKRMGFEIVREQVTDIGNRFVMDDFVMELRY